jgi:peptide/nickel transport system substrate-binding protein
MRVGTGRVVQALALGTAIALLAVGCTGGKPKRKPTAAPLPRGGTLRVGAPGLADEQAPLETSHGTFDIAFDPQQDFNGETLELDRCCLLRTLFSYNGHPTNQGGGEVHPDLAAALPQVSSDGLVWTIHLKPGIHYSPPLQNIEVTAQDFIRTLERGLRRADPAFDEASRSPLVDFAGFLFQDAIRGAREYSDGRADTISGLEAPDAHTLIVHLTRPTGDLAYRFSQVDSAPIPPNPSDPTARLGVAQGHDETYGRFLVGTGPYMVEGTQNLDFSKPPTDQVPVSGFVPGKSLTLVRNPSWHPSTDSLRPSYVEGIDVTLGQSPEETASEVEDGRLDVAFQSASPEEYGKYVNDAALRGRAFVNENDVLFLLSMNVAAPPFDDLHVRRAVNMAIDKNSVRRLAEIRQPSLVGPQGGDVAGHVVVNSLSGNLLLSYNPYGGAAGGLQHAKAEIAMSMYDRDHDGVCDAAACANVVAVVRNNDPFWPGLAGIVRRALAPLGIHLDVQSTDVQTFFGKLLDPTTHTPLSLGARFLKDFPNASSYMTANFGSESLPPDGTDFSLVGASPAQLRTWGYAVRNVPSVDDRIAACLSVTGEAEVRCWASLDQHVMTEVVSVVPLLFGTYAQTVSARVLNYSYDQFADGPALDQIALRP